MKQRTLVIGVLVLAALVIAVLAGLGTGDSFTDDGDLWGDAETPDTVQVESSR